MAESKLINWPNRTTLTGRSSTITSAFVHSITPWLKELSIEEEQAVYAIYKKVEDVYGIKILGNSREENLCAYCGLKATSADHIHSLVNDKTASGDITEIYNLLPCCSTCNSSKGSKTFEEWYESEETKNRIQPITDDYERRKEALKYLIGELDKHSSRDKVLEFYEKDEVKERLKSIYQKRDHINDLLQQYSEECLQFAFEAEMSLKKVGIIAQEEIVAIIKKGKNRDLVEYLLNKEYCKKYFKLNYSILSAEREKDANGYYRYYSTPIKIGRKEYYLCKEWKERNRKPLLNWISENTK